MLSENDVKFMSYRQKSMYVIENSLKILQSHPEVAKFGNFEGYVYIPAFSQIFEKTTGIVMSDELLSIVKTDKNIMINPAFPKYIRAIYGHSGNVLSYMLAKTHTRYEGPREIFAFTHVSMDGLGVLNSGRSVNMLIAPEFLANKGVKAYVNIKTLAENGIQVWKQNGDVHTARVFCYSPGIINFVYNFDFSSEYLKEDNLFRTHHKLVDVFRIIYSQLDKESFEKTAKKKLLKLILVDEDAVVEPENEKEVDAANELSEDDRDMMDMDSSLNKLSV
jgi:hypothetical protein